MNPITKFRIWRADKYADKHIDYAEHRRLNLRALGGTGIFLAGLTIGGILSWAACGFTDRTCVVKEVVKQWVRR